MPGAQGGGATGVTQWHAHAQMTFTIILTGRVDVHSEYMSAEARGDSPP